MKLSSGIITELVKASTPASRIDFKPIAVNLGPGTSVIAPPNPVNQDGTVNIMFQFRGGSPSIAGRSGTNAVIVMADAGGVGGGASRSAFGTTAFINQSVEKILSAIKESYNANVRLGNLGLSGWSGGYAPIHAIIAQHQQGQKLIKEPDYVGLFDGMHHSDQASLDVWKRLADEAKAGGTTFTVVHTAVQPEGYPSTTENANWLVQQEGIERQPAQNWTGQGVTPETIASSGGLNIVQLYSQSDPYTMTDGQGRTRPNIPGTAGWQHLQALQSIPDFWPKW